MNMQPRWIEVETHHWTIEEEHKLKMLFEAGSSDDEIGVRLMRTAGAVRVHRSKLGIKRANNTPYSEADDRMVKTMVEAGASDDMISTEIGRTVGSVTKRRRVLGLMIYKRGVERQKTNAEKVLEWLRGNQVTPNHSLQLKAGACLVHLHDLHREMGRGGYINLDIPNEDGGPRKVHPVVEQLSYCGSSSAMCCD